MKHELMKPALNTEIDINIPVIPNVRHNLGVIETFTNELEEYYNSILITKDNLSEATSERTKVNSLLKNISDKRKEVTRQFEEPISDFLATTKRIETNLKNISDNLKQRIDVFVDMEKEEKRKSILELISQIKEEFNSAYPNYKFNADLIVFNEKWVNKTAKKSDIHDDILAQFEEQKRDFDKYIQDCEIIMNVFNTLENNPLDKNIYIERYKHTRDVSSVMQDIQRDYVTFKNSQSNNSEVANKNTNTDKSLEVIEDPFAGLSIHNEEINNGLTSKECEEMLIKLVQESSYDVEIKEKLIEYVRREINERK